MIVAEMGGQKKLTKAAHRLLKALPLDKWMSWNDIHVMDEDKREAMRIFEDGR